MTTTKMAVDRRHTHRGTCQACGRLQAHQNTNGLVAKHGYTVDWGFFNGVCMGADAQPLELDRSMTDQIIKTLRTVEAPKHDKHAAALQAGTVEPQWKREVIACHYPRRDGRNTFNFNRIDIECTRAELSDYDAGQQLAHAIYVAKGKAEQARSHADMLVKMIATRHGQPLVAVNRDARKNALAVGARVMIGGKKGNACEIVEFKHIQTRGFSGWSNRCNYPRLHAVVKRLDNGHKFAVLASTIRQSAILEGGAQ